MNGFRIPCGQRRRMAWAIGLALPLFAVAAPAANAAPKVEWVFGSQHQARAFEISTSRVHLVDSFELRGGFDTRAEAEAEVKRLLAIDARTKAAGPGIMSGWDFAVIRVEERRAPMKGQTELDLAVAAINRLYGRVKRIRDVELRYFASGSKFSTPDTRAEANRTIAYFNQELRLVRERFGEAFEKRTGRMMVELPLIGEPAKRVIFYMHHSVVVSGEIKVATGGEYPSLAAALEVAEQWRSVVDLEFQPRYWISTDRDPHGPNVVYRSR